MSEPTFTPGPWTYVGGSVWNHDATFRIALMDREEPRTRPVERDANAKLIAAAPALYEALEAAVREIDALQTDAQPECDWDRLCGTKSRLIAALAQARGEK